MKLTVTEFQTLMRDKDESIKDLTQQLYEKIELIKQLRIQLTVEDTDETPLPLCYELDTASTSREYVFFAWDIHKKHINAFIGKKLPSSDWCETKTTAKFDSSRVVAFWTLG